MRNNAACATYRLHQPFRDPTALYKPASLLCPKQPLVDGSTHHPPRYLTGSNVTCPLRLFSVFSSWGRFPQVLWSQQFAFSSLFLSILFYTT